MQLFKAITMDTNVWKHLGGNSTRGKKQKFDLMWWLPTLYKKEKHKNENRKTISKWKNLLGSWDSAWFSFYMSLWLWDYLCPKNEVIGSVRFTLTTGLFLWRNTAMFEQWCSSDLLEYILSILTFETMVFIWSTGESKKVLWTCPQLWFVWILTESICLSVHEYTRLCALS